MIHCARALIKSRINLLNVDYFSCSIRGGLIQTVCSGDETKRNLRKRKVNFGKHPGWRHHDTRWRQTFFTYKEMKLSSVCGATSRDCPPLVYEYDYWLLVIDQTVGSWLVSGHEVSEPTGELQRAGNKRLKPQTRCLNSCLLVVLTSEGQKYVDEPFSFGEERWEWFHSFGRKHVETWMWWFL